MNGKIFSIILVLSASLGSTIEAMKQTKSTNNTLWLTIKSSIVSPFKKKRPDFLYKGIINAVKQNNTELFEKTYKIYNERFPHQPLPYDDKGKLPLSYAIEKHNNKIIFTILNTWCKKSTQRTSNIGTRDCNNNNIIHTIVNAIIASKAEDPECFALMLEKLRTSTPIPGTFVNNLITPNKGQKTPLDLMYENKLSKILFEAICFLKTHSESGQTHIWEYIERAINNNMQEVASDLLLLDNEYILKNGGKGAAENLLNENRNIDFWKKFIFNGAKKDAIKLLREELINNKNIETSLEIRLLFLTAIIMPRYFRNTIDIIQKKSRNYDKKKLHDCKIIFS